MTAADYIQALGLQAHPEGGFYKESYRSAGWIGKDCLPGFTGQRNFSTSIYFLLPEGSYSAFHRIKSDEGWHFYEGGCLRIHVIEDSGHYRCPRAPGLPPNRKSVPPFPWSGVRSPPDLILRILNWGPGKRCFITSRSTLP